MTRKTKLLIAGLLSVTALGGAAVAADTMRPHGPMRADTNGDGIVSRAEFFTAAETRFKSADADGNKVLSGTELQDRRGRFARLDTDNDGKLSFAEQAAGTTTRFRALDTDGDGKLTPEELAHGHHGRHGRDADLAHGPEDGPMARGGGMLMRADTNGDGRITREEMRAQADQRFDRLDANRDGVIDQAEMQAARGKMGQGMRRGGWRNQGMDDMPPPPAGAPAPPPPPKDQ